MWRGIRRGIPICGSAKCTYNTDRHNSASQSTFITIEANEYTPLLIGRERNRKQYYGNNHHAYEKRISAEETPSNSNTNRSSCFNSVTLQFCEIRLMAIGFILVAGFTIATYLLIMQARLPSMRFSLDLVNHDIWCKLNVPLGDLLDHSNVRNVMMMHTGGKNCDDPENCVNVLKEMQSLFKNETEIPYNFLIGGDGQTYEIRGWDHEHGFGTIPQNSSLVIGFMGNYTNTAPSEVQLQSALSLIKESIRRKKLQAQYQIYGLRNLTASHTDGEALFTRINKWPRFDTLLHVF